MEQSNRYNYQLLKNYRKAIPFLREIPDEIYFGIDPIGYFLPKGMVAKAREELEEKLGNFVMSYDRTIFKVDIPLKAHMCALLKGAILTKKQQGILGVYERRFQDMGVSFVVYEKPLVFLNPYKSLLATLYKKKGLWL